MMAVEEVRGEVRVARVARAQALAVAGDVVMGMAVMEEMDHGDTDSETPFKAAQQYRRRS